jgi:hypothetical protein
VEVGWRTRGDQGSLNMQRASHQVETLMTLDVIACKFVLFL